MYATRWLLAVVGAAGCIMGTAWAQEAGKHSLSHVVKEYLECIELARTHMASPHEALPHKAPPHEVPPHKTPPHAVPPHKVAAHVAVTPHEDKILAHERHLDDLGRGDPRVTFVKMLGALGRGHFYTANKLFVALPREYRRSPLVLKTKICASVETKDDVGAEREMALLIHWASADKVDGEAKPESAEAARFVGQVFGYLAGPAKRPQPEYEKQIAHRLAPDYVAACEAGKREVLKQYTQIARLAHAAREKAKAEEHKRRQEEIAKIVHAQGDLEKQLAGMQEHLKKAEGVHGGEIAKYTGELGVCGKQLEQCTLAISTLEKKAHHVQEQIDVIHKKLMHPDLPPHEKEKLLAEKGELESELATVTSDLAKRKTECAKIEAHHHDLTSHFATANSHVQPHRKAVDELHANLEALKKRQKGLHSQPLLGNTPHVAALEHKSKSIQTYLPHFWESAKKKVLHTFP